MTQSPGQSKRVCVTLARTAAVLVLFAVCALPAAAQSGAQADRHAAVRKLLETAGAHKVMAVLFEEMVSRYQKNWPDAVIAGYREKRLFDGLTPAETKQMEALIREFGDRVFAEIKARVVGQVVTEANLVTLSAPVFEKYLDEEELGRLTEFLRTPTGQKLVSIGYKHMSEASLSVMESKGMFNVSSDPDADVARLDQLMKDVSAGGLFADVQKEFAARSLKFAAEFTPEEMRDLAVFWQSPLGAKLIEIYQPLGAEIFQRNAALYAPRAGQIAGEVINEQLEFFKERTGEILKDAGPRMKAAAERRRQKN